MHGRQPSRRFACDRCRTYKLRCERPSVSSERNGCGRCIKANLVCKTTTPTSKPTASTTASSTTSHHGFLTGPEPWNAGRNEDISPIRTPLQQLSSETRPGSVNSQRSSVPPSSSQNTLVGTSGGQGSVNPMQLARLALSPPQRSLPQVPDKLPDVTDIDNCDIGDSDDMVGLEEAVQVNAMDFMMVGFGCNDASSGPTVNSDQQDEIGMLGSAGSVDEFDMSPPSESSEDDLQSPLKHAMKFCATLIEHYHSLKNNPFSPLDESLSKSMDRRAQAGLDYTSRLLEILESLTSTNAPPHKRRMSYQNAVDGGSSDTSIFNGDLSATMLARTTPQPGHEVLLHVPKSVGDVACSNPACNDSTGLNSSKKPESYDILLMTALVTSYVYLIRMWRSAFSLLHRILASGPGQTAGLLKLPSLQFGSYQILNNPSLQIQVLIEVRNDLFQRIEVMLGIATPDTYGRCSDNGAHKRPVLSLSPVAVSIRETLLHQERMRAATEDGIADFSLKDITTKVKHLLDAQG